MYVQCNMSIYQCDKVFIASVTSQTTATFVVNTTFGTDVEIRQQTASPGNGGAVCR